MNKPTRSQAVQLARKLHAEGLNSEDLAKKLAEIGYVSLRTGQPLSPAGALTMALYGKERKRKCRKDVNTSICNDRLALVKRILETKSLASEDRIALALLSL